MKKYKLVSIFALSFLLTTLWAEDFTFDSLITGEEDVSASFGGLKMGGKILVPARYTPGNFIDSETWKGENLLNGTYSICPDVILDLSYAQEKTEFTLSMNLDPENIGVDLLNEMTLTYYGDLMTVKAGYQIKVWGKGDKIHVVDLLNPMDYSDFLNTDYLDRKIAQPMLSLSLPLLMNSQIELVYVPTFTPDQQATEGIWMLSESQALAKIVTSGVTTSALSTYATVLAATTSAPAATAAMVKYMSGHSDLDKLLPVTTSLDFGQGAARLTASYGGVDMGVLYYYGRNRTPSLTVTGSSYEDMTISYDKLHVMGAELGTVLAGFNLRGEAAYYITEDYTGDNKSIHNPSLNYLVGFDKNLPLNNLNLNCQITGSYRLFDEKTKVSGDIEKDSDLSKTLVITRVSDSWNHEKITPELSLVYRIEDKSSLIKSSVEFDLDGNMSFTAAGSLFTGDEDSLFGQFNNNDFLEVIASYSF